MSWLEGAAGNVFEEFDARLRGIGSYVSRGGAGEWLTAYLASDIEGRQTKYDELRQTGGVFRRGDDGAQQG